MKIAPIKSCRGCSFKGCTPYRTIADVHFCTLTGEELKSGGLGFGKNCPLDAATDEFMARYESTTSTEFDPAMAGVKFSS